MNSRIQMKAKPVFVFLLFSISIPACSGKLQPYKSQNRKALDYTIQLDVISSGFDGESCWFHPRAGVIPGKRVHRLHHAEMDGQTFRCISMKMKAGSLLSRGCRRVLNTAPMAVYMPRGSNGISPIKAGISNKRII